MRGPNGVILTPSTVENEHTGITAPIIINPAISIKKRQMALISGNQLNPLNTESNYLATLQDHHRI